MKTDVLEYIKSVNQSELMEEEIDIQEPDSRVSDALNRYFSSINSLVEKESDSINQTKQLDFFLSKRFLMTAYNNLSNFDPAIHDHKDITEKLKLVRELEKAYHSAGDKVNVPELAFDVIFLRSQPEYIQYLSDKERCLTRISVASTLIQSLSPELQEREAQIKKLSKNSTKRKVLEEEIKPIRGKYVDSVDEKAKFTEELKALPDLKEIYTQKYFTSFIEELSKLSAEYKEVLGTILNFKASELDALIWENAANSKLIQEYFRDSGIYGDYCTETYLQYYLNTLDKSKLGAEQRELTEFLKHLGNK